MGLVVLMMSGYQSTRILVWQDPWAYPRDGGYQIIQSLYAIGSADCWAWAWARAGRSSSTCPSRRTTSSSPSCARSWA